MISLTRADSFITAPAGQHTTLQIPIREGPPHVVCPGLAYKVDRSTPCRKGTCLSISLLLTVQGNKPREPPLTPRPTMRLIQSSPCPASLVFPPGYLAAPPQTQGFPPVGSSLQLPSLQMAPASVQRLKQSSRKSSGITSFLFLCIPTPQPTSSKSGYFYC